jgi:arsenate reductase
MKEVGIDISKHTSNNVNEYLQVSFDIILTVCDHAKENCPYIPSNAKRFHHNFSDPSKVKGSEEEIANAFRTTRDDIKEYSKKLLEENL